MKVGEKVRARDLKEGDCFNVFEPRPDRTQSVYRMTGRPHPRFHEPECVRWIRLEREWSTDTYYTSGDSEVWLVPDPSRPRVDRGRFPHRCRCGSPAYFGVTPAAYECSNSGCLRPVMEGR